MTKITLNKICIFLASFLFIISIVGVIANAMSREYIGVFVWLMGLGLCLFCVNGCLEDIWQIKRKELLDEFLNKEPNDQRSVATEADSSTGDGKHNPENKLSE
jgi:uncharacterized membrane protein YidH (DUF202 family)